MDNSSKNAGGNRSRSPSPFHRLASRLRSRSGSRSPSPSPSPSTSTSQPSPTGSSFPRKASVVGLNSKPLPQIPETRELSPEPILGPAVERGRPSTPVAAVPARGAGAQSSEIEEAGSDLPPDMSPKTRERRKIDKERLQSELMTAVRDCIDGKKEVADICDDLQSLHIRIDDFTAGDFEDVGILFVKAALRKHESKRKRLVERKLTERVKEVLVKQGADQRTISRTISLVKEALKPRPDEAGDADNAEELERRRVAEIIVGLACQVVETLSSRTRKGT